MESAIQHREIIFILIESDVFKVECDFNNFVIIISENWLWCQVCKNLEKNQKNMENFIQKIRVPPRHDVS